MTKPNLQELGATGLSHYAGRVYEEFIPELAGDRWCRVARRMMNDPVISAVLFSIEMLAREVDWTFEPASEAKADMEAAEFFRGALFEDMSLTWDDTLSEILTFLAWGWCYPEILYKSRQGEGPDPTRRSRFTDGRVGWRKWASRAQETRDRWEFDEGGGVRAMIQAPPPDFRERRIPIEKALLFRTSAHKGNPEPPGILRRAYRPWYFKSRIENIEGVGIERDLAGLPVAWVPPELLSSEASPEEKQVLSVVQQIVTSIRRDEQEGLVFPLAYHEGTSNKLYDLTLLTSGGRRQFDTSAIIQRYDQRIAMTVLADFIFLGHTAVGTYELSADKTELFSVALGAWLDMVCDVVNRHAVPRLGDLNGMPRESLPRLRRGTVEAPDLAGLGDYITKLTGAQISFTPQQVTWLKQQVKGMPVDEREEQELLDRKGGGDGERGRGETDARDEEDEEKE